LAALGFLVRKYHMNEGHAALLTLELLNETYRHNKLNDETPWNQHKVAEKCIFTTHTPVASGHDRFPYPLVEQVLGPLVPVDVLKQFGGNEELNMTVLALKLSGFVNGVAKKHREVSTAIFPGFKIHAITNGIHPFTWASPFFINLYNDYLPGWANEPEVLVRIDSVPDEELWDAHDGAKSFLFQYVAEETGITLDPEILTIGFARRATAYKRGDLIFSDINRLLKIGAGRLQLIFSGKAHPHDAAGKEMIRRIIEGTHALGGMVRAVYLENYNMEIASKMIPGVDLWLNTPMRPLEASGTSGMKAALNGVPNFSILDGWWLEGHIEGVTGWSIGSASSSTAPDRNHDAEDALDLYHKLEKLIIPLYYNDRPGWIRLMKNAIGKNAYYFNTHSMMRRYVTEAYIH
ncbi:MAG: alpha-glucan family phosphorylase, partial [Desulfuromonadales bacterium]|nr:alpha-glucan family phosphorylase [Desulfuromonadales bacterium]